MRSWNWCVLREVSFQPKVFRCRAKALNKVSLPSQRWKRTWLRCLAAFGMAKSWPLENFKDLEPIQKRSCVHWFIDSAATAQKFHLCLARSICSRDAETVSSSSFLSFLLMQDTNPEAFCSRGKSMNWISILRSCLQNLVVWVRRQGN